MKALWVRLTLAFALVTAGAILLAALLANFQVSTQFRQFVSHSQMMDAAAPALVQYYVDHGGWAGVETMVENLPAMGMGSGNGRGLRRGAPKLVLADAAGQIVYNGSGQMAAGPLARQNLADALPLELNGQVVGYLLAEGQGQGQLTGAAQNFLGQINRSLLQAGLLAGGLGVLLSLIIARSMSAPLTRLAGAARRIAQGRLEERVPVSGAQEFTHLAAAFNDMAHHLQQAETLRRNLVADIAHELRTPLTIIQGNLQAILDDVFPLDKAEIAGIYDETLILNRLIADLRDLAQAEAGQLDLNLEPVDLSALVGGQVELFAELARDKPVGLTAAVPAGLPPVLADADRLRQVLHNLLANAVRHTPANGIVTVAVEGSGDGPSGFVRITVADTGPGIAPADLPHVFDRFWRADKSRSRQQGGSGLGLAIARQWVEAHGGQIGVESQGVPGQGSRFWFTLPVA
jgi:two-component system OmpR family sensor kinase/two-component system sensor histidine kinase BaeS